MVMDVKYKGQLYERIVIKDNYIEDLSELDIFREYNNRLLLPNELDGAQNSKYAIITSIIYGDDAILDFHFQLKLLYALGGESYLLEDITGSQVFSGEWLKSSAMSDIPPSPDNMYKTDSVHDGHEEVWLHSHGFNRLGIMDLDILYAVEDPRKQYSMFTMLIKYLIDNKELAVNNIPFYVNEDIKIVLIDAAASIPLALRLANKQSIIGGYEDRDDQHLRGRSAIFILDESNNYNFVNSIIENLSDNPIFWISSKETQRMSEKSVETYEYFKMIYNDKYTEDEKWEFLVKVGCLVDESVNDEDKEHLWFEVTKIEGNDITGILINEPYYIKSMKAGQPFIFDYNKLTEWTIYAPDGLQIVPENVFAYPFLYLNYNKSN
ncbi:MAG: DUF4026 domain-containing protein [Leptotrichiaceae bacterium]|nr:DUF4026 domain-containing protein [Leptotrichiaceae bacterium]MBP9629601.1 DUF4026 domain-containing protein [Leptotrichiaceae bacterium]